MMTNDIFLKQEVDAAGRVDAVDKRHMEYPELELQHLVRL